METISLLTAKAAFKAYAKSHHIELKRFFEPDACMIRLSKDLSVYKQDTVYPIWFVGIPTHPCVLICQIFATPEKLKITLVPYDVISTMHCLKKKLTWQMQNYRLCIENGDKKYLKKTIKAPSFN